MGQAGVVKRNENGEDHGAAGAAWAHAECRRVRDLAALEETLVRSGLNHLDMMQASVVQAGAWC